MDSTTIRALRMSRVLEQAQRVQTALDLRADLSPTRKRIEQVNLLNAIFNDYNTIKSGDGEPVDVTDLDAELNGKRQSATDFE